MWDIADSELIRYLKDDSSFAYISGETKSVINRIDDKQFEIKNSVGGIDSLLSLWSSVLTDVLRELKRGDSRE